MLRFYIKRPQVLDRLVRKRYRSSIVRQRVPGLSSELTDIAPCRCVVRGSEMSPLNLAYDHSAPRRVHGRRRAVVVSGDEARQTLLALILEDLGYTPSARSNGMEALLGWDADVDVVITDLVLSDMFGTELARRIHRRSPSTRFLFASRCEPKQWPRAVFSALRGVPPPYWYLPEPFSAQDLRAHLEEYRAESGFPNGSITGNGNSL